MKPFEQVEHTADAGIRAYGSDLEEVFLNCALGMVSLMLDPERVRRERRIRLEASAGDLEALLVAWLSEIIFRMETENLAFGGFEDMEVKEGSASSWGWGETLDPERHGLKLEIKAPTYHGLELKRRGDRWTAQVIFDV